MNNNESGFLNIDTSQAQLADPNFIRNIAEHYKVPNFNDAAPSDHDIFKLVTMCATMGNAGDLDAVLDRVMPEERRLLMLNTSFPDNSNLFHWLVKAAQRDGLSQAAVNNYRTCYGVLLQHGVERCPKDNAGAVPDHYDRKNIFPRNVKRPPVVPGKNYRYSEEEIKCAFALAACNQYDGIDREEVESYRLSVIEKKDFSTEEHLLSAINVFVDIFDGIFPEFCGDAASKKNPENGKGPSAHEIRQFALNLLQFLLTTYSPNVLSNKHVVRLLGHVAKIIDDNVNETNEVCKERCVQTINDYLEQRFNAKLAPQEETVGAPSRTGHFSTGQTNVRDCSSEQAIQHKG